MAKISYEEERKLTRALLVACGMGIVAFVLSKFIAPSLAIAGQPIYTTFIVSLVMYFVAAIADKRVCFEGQYVYKES